MREIVPGAAIVTVILPYRAPGAFTHIGAPAPPGGAISDQALLFFANTCLHEHSFSSQQQVCQCFPIIYPENYKGSLPQTNVPL